MRVRVQNKTKSSLKAHNTRATNLKKNVMQGVEAPRHAHEAKALITCLLNQDDPKPSGGREEEFNPGDACADVHDGAAAAELFVEVAPSSQKDVATAVGSGYGHHTWGIRSVSHMFPC